MSNLLIVFCKNPVLGKVKTRLSKSIGDKAALEVYQKLLLHTHEVSKATDSQYAVYYADYVNENDLWNDATYKEVQAGEDIGARMNHAISDALSRGYESVILVGADIYALTPGIIDRAFSQLTQSNIVLGPAEDGGYYLIGMKQSNPELFQLNKWSCPQVLNDTLEKANVLGLSYQLVDKLNDIDYYDDLQDTDLLDPISTPQDLE